MNVLRQIDKRFENCPINGQKWLINVSEEPDMINVTLDNERSSNKFLFGIRLLLVLQAIRKN